jgi:hypothetical protein
MNEYGMMDHDDTPPPPQQQQQREARKARKLTVKKYTFSLCSEEAKPNCFSKKINGLLSKYPVSHFSKFCAQICSFDHKICSKILYF